MNRRKEKRKLNEIWSEINGKGVMNEDSNIRK